jgi:hypothetical protein
MRTESVGEILDRKFFDVGELFPVENTTLINHFSMLNKDDLISNS